MFRKSWRKIQLYIQKQPHLLQFSAFVQQKQNVLGHQTRYPAAVYTCKYTNNACASKLGLQCTPSSAARFKRKKEGSRDKEGRSVGLAPVWWINHSQWHMVSGSPDLRSPSQPQSVTALWPVPSYTAWWERHIGVSSLPRPLRNGARLWLEPATYVSQVPYPTTIDSLK